MTAFVHRLRNARKIAQDVGGASAFARRMSMSRQQASHIIGSNPIKHIGDDIARRIEATFLYPTGWLDQPHDEPTGASPEAPFYDIPAMDMATATGDVTIAQPMQVLEWVRIPKDWLRLNASAAYESLRLMTYNSDDMATTIAPNSVLLLDRSQSRVSGAGLYVLSEKGTAYVRRAQLAAGQVRLSCDNEAYPARTVESCESAGLLVLGRVLTSWATHRH